MVKVETFNRNSRIRYRVEGKEFGRLDAAERYAKWVNEYRAREASLKALNSKPSPPKRKGGVLFRNVNHPQWSACQRKIRRYATLHDQHGGEYSPVPGGYKAMPGSKSGWKAGKGDINNGLIDDKKEKYEDANRDYHGRASSVNLGKIIKDELTKNN